MKTLSIILAILPMGVPPASIHPLDEAAQALSEGRPAQATELYRQANAVHPTREGLNNLGVALERMGRYREAGAAYREALQVSDTRDGVRANLIRTQVRAAIWTGWPHMAGLFLGLSGLFLLRWLIGFLLQAWRRFRYRLKFRKIRLVGLNYRVQDREGQESPEGRVYPDSDTLAFKADLLLPNRPEIYPLALELELVRPNGQVLRTHGESVERFQAEKVTLWFQADQLEPVLQCPGGWDARLVLRNIGRTLGSVGFPVIDRAALTADLTAATPRLLALCGGQTRTETVVFPDVEAVVPCTVIRPRSCHPGKYAGFQVHLDLVNLDKPEAPERMTFPLEFRGGVMEIGAVSRPIAGDAIAQKVGRWEFRIAVEDRILVHIPFTITSFEQALANIRLESFEIAGTFPSGHIGRVGNRAIINSLKTLAPIAVLATQYPCPRIKYRLTLGACLNGEPVAGAEAEVSFEGTSLELMPGEFHIPFLEDQAHPVRIGFALMLEGRVLGVREVVLHRQPPRCADAQGRIMTSPADMEMDYDCEAARILQEAKVRRH